MLKKILFSFFLFSVFFASSVGQTKAAACATNENITTSGCECAAPKSAVFDESLNNLYCVSSCSANANVYGKNGLPSCACLQTNGQVISESGKCVSNLPQCTPRSPVEGCTCLSPLRQVQSGGSQKSYCVAVCGNGELAENGDGVPQCACPGTVELDGTCNENRTAGSDGLGGNITKEDFNAFNPLRMDGLQAEDSTVDSTSLTNPGAIISRLLAFAFPLAGLILFVMIVWGGFEMVYSASSSKGLEAGKQRVTAAIIGFFLLFSSYWIAQILELVFGIKIF